MSDRLFFSGAALAAGLIIALALVWPQGDGLPSPKPFGGPQVVPEAAKVDQAKEARRAKAKAAREANPSKAVGLR